MWRCSRTASGVLSPAGTVIGYKRLLRFADSTISKFRIRFTQFRVRPTLASIGLYFAPAILSPPKIVRDRDGNVTIETPDGTCARYTLDGANPTNDSQLYTDPIPMPKGGVIVAQTFPLTPAKYVGDVTNSIARMQFGLAKAKWKILDCDSQDAAKGTHARQLMTIHALSGTRVIAIGSIRCRITSLLIWVKWSRFGASLTLPRQDQWDGGIITRARFEVSQDGKDWIVAADNVDFDNIVNSRQQQVVKLPDSHDGPLFSIDGIANGKRQQSSRRRRMFQSWWK